MQPPLSAPLRVLANRGIPVLVDAAHALGQLHVDLEELQADYYVTNCHKQVQGGGEGCTRFMG